MLNWVYSVDGGAAVAAITFGGCGTKRDQRPSTFWRGYLSIIYIHSGGGGGYTHFPCFHRTLHSTTTARLPLGNHNRLQSNALKLPCPR